MFTNIYFNPFTRNLFVNICVRFKVATFFLWLKCIYSAPVEKNVVDCFLQRHMQHSLCNHWTAFGESCHVPFWGHSIFSVVQSSGFPQSCVIFVLGISECVSYISNTLQCVVLWIFWCRCYDRQYLVDSRWIFCMEFLRHLSFSSTIAHLI